MFLLHWFLALILDERYENGYCGEDTESSIGASFLADEASTSFAKTGDMAENDVLVTDSVPLWTESGVGQSGIGTVCKGEYVEFPVK